VVGPFSGAVDYRQDFYSIPADAVGNNKRCTGDHKFARPTVTPSRRMLPQNLSSFFNPINEMVCRGWVILVHVRAIEVFGR
jgi:hypothetical protein